MLTTTGPSAPLVNLAVALLQHGDDTAYGGILHPPEGQDWVHLREQASSALGAWYAHTHLDGAPYVEIVTPSGSKFSQIALIPEIAVDVVGGLVGQPPRSEGLVRVALGRVALGEVEDVQAVRAAAAAGEQFEDTVLGVQIRAYTRYEDWDPAIVEREFAEWLAPMTIPRPDGLL